MKKTLRLLAVFFIASSDTLLAAPPDAGQLLREQQSQIERKPVQRLPAAEAPVATKPPAAPSGPAVFVKALRFTGYEGLTTEPELQTAVKGAVGTNATAADLARLADRVTDALRAKGYFLARAYLPKQDVTSGVVEIAVIQARSDGDVAINRAKGVRLREQYLKGMVDRVIKPGQPLRESDLEHVLLLMNGVPGITARAVLAPGTRPGTTRITINVSEAKLFTGAIWADNHGNRYTGSLRGSGLVSINDPFRTGDQFNLMFSGAEGLAQGRVAYSVPVGSRGLRGNVSYTTMRYKLIDDLSSLGAKGTAQTLDAGVSYPLVRSRTFNLSANAGGESKILVDKIGTSTIRDKRLKNGRLGLGGDHPDRFNGGGHTTWSASATMGSVDLSKNPTDEFFDKIGPRTSGSYAHYNFTASRLQRVSRRLAFSGSYFGQLASGNLDSSEKFNLGGPYGVRAYPVGEASGDEGHLFNFELRDELPLDFKGANIQLIGFVDTGRVTQHKKTWTNAVTTATGENGYWLSGAGVGVIFSRPGQFSLRVSYAHKLGDNPGRTADTIDFFGNVVARGGKDADGRKSDGRLWLMGQVMF